MKKWYELFVTVDPDQGGTPSGQSGSGGNDPAQTVADIAASLGPPPPAMPSVLRSQGASQAGAPPMPPRQNPTGRPMPPGAAPAGPPPPPMGPVPEAFDDIYNAAEIATPKHGYTVFKVAQMLESEHIRSLPVEVKRSSVLLALEAAGVRLQEVVEDAVKRDRALDAFERVRQRALDELANRKLQENQQIEADLNKLMAEYRNRIQANNEEIRREEERFHAWLLKKHQEEQRIADALGPFLSENPITRGSAPAKPQGQ